MRDEFSEEVKRVVALRVGQHCSNPDCRALTSGPQDDPAKAVNVGVAAHIAAASEGGPRYDPDMLTDERKSPTNAVWLCHNCAKLVDNDVHRFPTELLQKWKREAEDATQKEVGKTATKSAPTYPELKPGRRVWIRPVIPRNHEVEQFLVETAAPDFFQVQKPSSMHRITIPTNAVQKIQSFGDLLPPYVMLDGRLQWRTNSRTWVYLPEQPPFGPVGQYGSWKNVGMFGLGMTDAWKGLESKWASERNLGRCLSEGWTIFYDEPGTYLRNPDPSGDLILICKQP
jgi:hypothetical protein